jgi:hypothetical protein
VGGKKSFVSGIRISKSPNYEGFRRLNKHKTILAYQGGKF